MNFHIMTLFPEMVMQGLNTSIIGRAMDKGLINIEAVNIRDYAYNKHNKVDDYIYGGGAGMLMQAEPVYLCYEAVKNRIESGESDENSVSNNASAGDDSKAESNTASERIAISEDDISTEINGERRLRVVYLTPQGEVFSQKKAEELAKEEELILLCGHYEGIDERVLEEIVTDNISIGDYVLTGGELPAMIVVDAVSRLIPGVLNNDVSAEFESFNEGLLEYPQYSRPEVWHDKKVPEVLLSGHHANVDKWRHEQAIQRTKERRPDLYDRYAADSKD
ncbi:MAG: tRNA (guanosine(37)-N1)-methyltransferase TrmD [Lachnospiraceae bacterium]|nr:tRNA (guanosine(37)-N1)-methyltransferase TrmD [Lachnospiraceae bacterium]